MIDLYYWPTPNGHKITLMLEELARGPRAPWAFIEHILLKADEEVPDLPTVEEAVSSETEASNEAEAGDDSDAAEVDAGVGTVG